MCKAKVSGHVFVCYGYINILTKIAFLWSKWPSENADMLIIISF